MLLYEVQTMHDLDFTQHNPDMFENQKTEVEQAVDVILEAKQDFDCEWAQEEFDNVAEMLKEWEAIR